MRKLSRFTIGLVAVISLVAGTGAASAAHLPSARHDTGPAYYLALGDSVGAGYQAPGIATDRACASTVADDAGQRGYTCLLYRKMLTVSPTMQFESLALAVSPGEDSCSFQSITNCENVTSRTDADPHDTPPYSINSVAQLSAAESFISTHNVAVISLNLGGNDFLPLLGLAEQADCSGYPNGQTNCVAYAESLIPTVESRLGSNLETVVGTLRTIAPHAVILLADQYNPLSGLPASALGPNGAAILSLAQGALSTYQTGVEALAAGTGSTYVDEYDLFTNIAPVVTWITSNQDIHPNAKGYLLLGKTYWSDFVHAAGIPLRISVKTAKKKLKAGAKQTFTIKSLPDSTVTTTITYRWKGWSYSATLSGVVGITGKLVQKWQPPTGVKKPSYQSCSSFNNGSKCETGRFIIA